MPFRRVRVAALACPLAVVACASILGIDPPEPRDTGADGPEGGDDGASHDGSDDARLDARPDSPLDAEPDASAPRVGDGGVSVISGQSGTLLVAVTDVTIYWARYNGTDSTVWSCLVKDTTSCEAPVFVTQSSAAPINLVALGQGESTRVAFATADGTIDLFNPKVTGSGKVNLASGIRGLTAFAAASSPTGGPTYDAYYYTADSEIEAGGPGVYVRYGSGDWSILTGAGATPFSVVATVETASGAAIKYAVAYTLPSLDPYFCEGSLGSTGCPQVQVHCAAGAVGCGVPSGRFVVPTLAGSTFAFATTSGVWATAVPTALMGSMMDPASDVTAITVLDRIVVWARTDGMVRARTYPPDATMPEKDLGTVGTVHSLAANETGVYAAVDEGVVFFPRIMLP
jgi:hypothetical protein